MNSRALTVRVVQFWLLALTIVLGYANATAAEDQKPAQILFENINIFDCKIDRFAMGMNVLDRR